MENWLLFTTRMAKISDNEITAVCSEEEQDEDDTPIFYAGDSEGNLYSVN